MRSWEFGHAKGNYVRAFGASNTATGPPMQQTFYQSIGSITKTFTVTAVLQLVDQGKVSLTDPISKYVAGVPDGDHITIRELARMQSGLFNYFDDQRFLESLFANPYQEWSPDQLLQIAFRHPPNFAPGTDFQYNNTNPVLLGLVVEKVAGQPLASYVQQRVLEAPASGSHRIPGGQPVACPILTLRGTHIPGSQVNNRRRTRPAGNLSYEGQPAPCIQPQ